jgi:hypothetical protein
MPFKVLASLVIKVLWLPSIIKQTHRDICINKYEDMSTSDLEKMVDTKVQKLYDTFDHESRVYRDGDSPKWYGLMDAAYGHVTDQYWRILMTYLSNDGVIGRYALGDPERSIAADYSGDMFSGLAIALSIRLKNKNLLKLDRDKLVKLWEKTTFETPVLAFAHPIRGKDTENYRPIFPLWGLASDLLKLLCWLELGYQVTGEVKYRKWYKRFRFVSWPMLWIHLGDMNMCLGKVYIWKWFTYHSRYLHMLAGYLSNEDVVFKDHAEQIFRKYGLWNLDLRALRHTFYKEHMADEELKSFYAGVSALLEKGTLAYPGEVKKWYSILGISKWLPKGIYSNGKLLLNKITFSKIAKLKLTVEEEHWRRYIWPINANRFLSYEYLGNKYVSEDHPFEPNVSTEDHRKGWGIDALVAWGFYQQSKN